MPREALPPYKRVAADLRDKITSGELLPGEQIPPIPRLMETYQVSRNTALRALSVLKDEGLITVEPGWGSFVAPR
jgi:GntR family transcriptional regulator